MSRSPAPELVTAADVLEYDLESNAVDAQGRSLNREPYMRRIGPFHSESLLKFRSELDEVRTSPAFPRADEQPSA